ncbi:MAG: HD domain-containing phosphohydrolase [Gaiellaceae bacterium]
MAAGVTSPSERVALVEELELETARRAASAVAMAALETRDESTAEHCDDVLTLCDAIGRRLELGEREQKQLIAGAQLHDIGKVGVPLSILNKPGVLTDVEWAVIREHTLIGERILRSVPAMAEVARVVRHSHEHWDGSGYPDGASGEEIPLASRVILCADAFHAMRSDRPYRRGRDAQAALAEIETCAGTQFDPRVAEALVAVANDARDGIPVKGDRLRQRRLIALLTALAIGTGGALAAAPGLRDAVKSLFAAAVPPSHAASDPVAPKDVSVGAFGELLRLPPFDLQPRRQASEHAAPSRHVTRSHEAAHDGARQPDRAAGARERKGSASPTAADRSSPAKEKTHAAAPKPTNAPRGRALGRDVPVPRRPASPPSHGAGGRTDPPALGREAGPHGRP